MDADLSANQANTHPSMPLFYNKNCKWVNIDMLLTNFVNYIATCRRCNGKRTSSAILITIYRVEWDFTIDGYYTLQQEH